MSGGLGITATSAVKPNYGVRVPCSTKDANGKNQTYSNYANVKVRVLNGTKFVGFAKAVSTALSNRQFKVTGGTLQGQEGRAHHNLFAARTPSTRRTR